MTKIALVGTAPASVRLAPYNSPEWTIWACSPGAYGVCPRTDAFFELHRYEPGQPWFSPEYCNFLREHPNLWVFDERTDAKNKNIVPYEFLIQKYGPYFFTSTLSWMFALAIEAGAKSIGLWGVDMAATEEYGYQRAGCQYFAQLARSMGIEVGIPPESDLLKPPPLYGLCEISHNWIKTTARQRELKARLEQVKVEHQNKATELAFLQGAIDDMTYFQNTYFGTMETMGQTYCEPPEVHFDRPQNADSSPPAPEDHLTAAHVIKSNEDYYRNLSGEALAKERAYLPVYKWEVAYGGHLDAGRDTPEVPKSPPGEAAGVEDASPEGDGAPGLDTEPRPTD